jgi:hypothetical protein
MESSTCIATTRPNLDGIYTNRLYTQLIVGGMSKKRFCSNNNEY